MSEDEVNEAREAACGENAEWELARRYVEETGRHLFLTGRAGTGKTTFLRRLGEESAKRMVVAAPTGVAAINAGGVTLHSFFQLPLGVLVPGSWEEGGGGRDRRFRFSREKRAIVQSLDLLVIDEISMVRADVLDAVDEVLRRLRGDERPFGGVQLLMIGDLRQLPPVAKDDEWELMKGVWPTAYFFGSRALAATEYRCIELRHVYRQKDESFVALLNDVRAGAPSAATLAALNARCAPRGAVAAEEGDGGGIVLCTHNAQAQAINEARLEALPGGGMDYAAQVTGTFPEASWPTEGALRLKTGAQVMFVKNDPDKRFFNGRIGRVTRLEAGRRAWVRCEGDASDIDVGPASWENLKYSADPESGQLRQEVAGTFSQLPLKLAWAITVHKSQGLTFDRVRLLADRSFAPGQVYVALSRCRTLEGLSLERPIPASAVTADPEIDRYVREIEARTADGGTLQADRLAYRADVLADVFRFRDLARPAYGLRRLAGTDPGSLAPGVPLALEGIYEAIALDMERVGERFAVQLRAALEGWTDPDRLPGALAARLEKGAEYYLPRLREQVLDAAAAVDVSTDNRAVGVALKRDLGRLADAARAKIAAMEALREGVGVAALLRRVAEARFAGAAESSAGRATARRGRSGSAGAPPPAPEALENAAGLIRELRAFRSRVAKDSHWPAYAVFSQKTLYGIAERLPLDVESLARVPGMGRSRAEKYGGEILPLVRAHAESTGQEGTTAGSTSLF